MRRKSCLPRLRRLRCTALGSNVTAGDRRRSTTSDAARGRKRRRSAAAFRLRSACASASAAPVGSSRAAGAAPAGVMEARVDGAFRGDDAESSPESSPLMMAAGRCRRCVDGLAARADGLPPPKPKRLTGRLPAPAVVAAAPAAEVTGCCDPASPAPESACCGSVATMVRVASTTWPPSWANDVVPPLAPPPGWSSSTDTTGSTPIPPAERWRRCAARARRARRAASSPGSSVVSIASSPSNPIRFSRPAAECLRTSWAWALMLSFCSSARRSCVLLRAVMLGGRGRRGDTRSAGAAPSAPGVTDDRELLRFRCRSRSRSSASTTTADAAVLALAPAPAPGPAPEGAGPLGGCVRAAWAVDIVCVRETKVLSPTHRLCCSSPQR